MPAPHRSFKPLRGAVVGYGFISSKGHVPAYLDRLRSRGDVEIVAIADICSARRSQARKDLRGVHVLCEKPLTPTLSEAASLLEHAARVRRVIFPCHNYKHAPVVKAIREILESGRSGQVRSITLNTF